ncbi:MAG: hypothetical protein COW85_12825 [Ignavibacteria bacterium CG22_combo_CG10-13_8_21_14_all_37_15]|nr:hypothetical protein [Ignavibacteria bacterium]OIO22584.1 MAG: hypothetical protein AUJ54_03125 [Ignavibacteria bacterium CG1_02_37_35]PIP76707.1 MAG: hypothetical protein COW85_12825 [Ignavibacteria bacterium CG22_combo_CG10-13_8_21_14_all_37_15]PIX94627.1 MAG: hypothetical protein COZ25_04645 [Ignavibacteria bacterium CG_4_10_14_3_um_filter_37_18]PJC58946.1 MAG: hypothetical protein CO025_07765 [Ignavibacteria bacterium CG_4_9_14_0_2_um_filter_37_13]
MKKQLFILFTFLSISSLPGGAFLDFINAKNEGENVRVEWKTSDERNVKEFLVERKTYQGEFSVLESIKPLGSNSYYSFLDQNAYKITDVIFIYRIKIVDYDNSVSYTKEVSVSHNISGVKRTWGSIKAMFR